MTEQPDTRPLGQIAFDAYNAERGGLTYDGKPTPPWTALGDGVRNGWTASALAVMQAATFVDHRIGGQDAGPERHASKAENAAWDAKVREYWWPIITRDGVIAEDLVLTELGVYSHVLNEVPEVYSAITNDKLSKPSYFASGVISIYEDEQRKAVDEAELELLLDVVEALDPDPATLDVLVELAEGHRLGDLRKAMSESRERQAQFQAIVDRAKGAPVVPAPLPPLTHLAQATAVTTTHPGEVVQAHARALASHRFVALGAGPEGALERLRQDLWEIVRDNLSPSGTVYHVRARVGLIEPDGQVDLSTVPGHDLEVIAP
ncbi:hypothetical protein [Deinococcus sp. Leaf326]|uniref:hypothetical protein n=1 Tax=Deinococcus sp. Leaf326 TaxID=1736338 RepID=UPI0006FFB114|nr:hypothetical protein [Deinococcus sp. Leaf326]KQR37774.1 hypothetical protein ASF71_14935 [Deinococcus sp. Leaf326]